MLKNFLNHWHLWPTCQLTLAGYHISLEKRQKYISTTLPVRRTVRRLNLIKNHAGQSSVLVSDVQIYLLFTPDGPAWRPISLHRTVHRFDVRRVTVRRRPNLIENYATSRVVYICIANFFQKSLNMMLKVMQEADETLSIIARRGLLGSTYTNPVVIIPQLNPTSIVPPCFRPLRETLKVEKGTAHNSNLFFLPICPFSRFSHLPKKSFFCLHWSIYGDGYGYADVCFPDFCSAGLLVYGALFRWIRFYPRDLSQSVNEIFKVKIITLGRKGFNIS